MKITEILLQDHDYSPPISAHPTPHSIKIEPTPPAVSVIQQPQMMQLTQPTSKPKPSIPSMMPKIPSAAIIQQSADAIIDDKQWFYRDPQNVVQGPFSSADMERWFNAGYFTVLLPVKRHSETQFTTIQQLMKEMGRSPFRSDIPSLPIQSSTNSISSSVVSEAMNFETLPYSGGPTSNSNTLDELLMQPQQRASAQQLNLFNR